MLLQFELDGQSCAAGAYTFTLSNALNFERLSLRSVSVQCGNDKLAQTWSYTTENVTFDGVTNSRALAAPLYLDMSSFLGDTSTAHYLPTVHPYGSARTQHPFLTFLTNLHQIWKLSPIIQHPQGYTLYTKSF